MSVLIPCYNAEKWIAGAIDSALDQEYQNIEIIVFDDGSEDESIAIIESYGDKIQCIVSAHVGGQEARNELLVSSKGTWLQYLDADDYLQEDKIENQVGVINEIGCENIDVLYGPVIMRYENIGSESILPIPEPRDPWSLLALWQLPQTGAPLWKKSSIENAGGWNRAQSVCQEHELYLRLLMADNKFIYSDDSGAVYRQWSQDTICRTNEENTINTRVSIMKTADKFLKETGGMTDRRQLAFDKAYMECARALYKYNEKNAENLFLYMNKDRSVSIIFDELKQPISYIIALHLLGFGGAEKLAKYMRPLKSIWNTHHFSR